MKYNLSCPNSSPMPRKLHVYFLKNPCHCPVCFYFYRCRNFAGAVLSLVVISVSLCRCFRAMSPVGIYPNRAFRLCTVPILTAHFSRRTQAWLYLVHHQIKPDFERKFMHQTLVLMPLKSKIFPLTSGILVVYFWCNQQGRPKYEFVLSVIHSEGNFCLFSANQ